MVNSVIFAFLAMFCWGVGDFLIQRSTRKIGVPQTLFTIGAIGSLVLLPFVWSDFKFLSSVEVFVMLFVFGLFTFAVSMINLEALKVGKLSVVEVLLEFELPITVILSAILLKEILSPGLIGLLIVLFFGLILVAMPKLNILKKFVFEHGAGLAILAAIGMGIINFITGYIAITVSPLLSVWFAWAVFTLVCFVYLVRKHNFRFKDKNNFVRKIDFLILLMSLLDTAAWVFFAYAIVGSTLSIATGITESYPAIALILGIFINKENITKHQLFGAIVVIVVSVLIGYFFG